MRTLAVVNMKGGVGKTTTAGHLLGAHGKNTIRELMLGDATLADTIVREVRPGLDAITATPPPSCWTRSSRARCSASPFSPAGSARSPATTW